MLRMRPALALALIVAAAAGCGSSNDEIAESDTPPSETTAPAPEQPPATASTAPASTAPAPTTTPEPASTTASPSTTTITDAAATDDTSAGLDEYCALWVDIRAATANSTLDSAEAWQQRIAWTEEIARLAPDEYQEQAQVYLTLVLAREQLVSEYGYVAVQELPADVRTAFISDHSADQQISNELIEFSTSTCFPAADE